MVVGLSQGEAPRKRKRRFGEGDAEGRRFWTEATTHVTSWCGLSEYVVDTGLFMFMFM